MPDIRFKRFSGEWTRLTLGDLGTVAMNKRIFKSQTTEKGDIPFYKIGTFGKEADAYISNELSPLSNFSFVKGQYKLNLFILFGTEYLFVLLLSGLAGMAFIELSLPKFRELSEINGNIYGESFLYFIGILFISFCCACISSIYFSVAMAGPRTGMPARRNKRSIRASSLALSHPFMRDTSAAIIVPAATASP